MVSILFIDTTSNAHAFRAPVTFCEAMQGEINIVHDAIDKVKRLRQGYTPETLLYDQRFNKSSTALDVERYKSLLDETLSNMEDIARLREETIALSHPPQTYQDYQECCRLTCDYLTKNKDIYQLR